MVMDVPGIGQSRYQTFEELYLYCYRCLSQNYFGRRLASLPSDLLPLSCV